MTELAKHSIDRRVLHLIPPPRIVPLRHRGMQLLELVISLASASILMAGMTSAILIANRSADIAANRQATSTRSLSGFDRLRTDISEGFPITARSDSQATVSVGDRDGDGNRETIQYQWLGVGSPLQVSVNAGAWQAATDNLDAFSIKWRSCGPQSTSNGLGQLEPIPSLVFQSRTFATTSFSGANSVAINVPATYQASDLLVAALAVSGDQGGSMIGPSGWTKVLETHNGTTVSLGVWISLSNSLSQANFSWGTSRVGYGTIAHFRVTGNTAALTNSSFFSGAGNLATAPTGIASVNNSLAVRVLAASGPLVSEEASNMPGHIAITMRRQLLANPIIGMSYRVYPVGTVPNADFGLPSSGTYATATLVFQP